MKRTITTLGLVAALLLVAALPASAAPRNANNEDFVLDVTCVDGDGVDQGWTAVRPTPSSEGKPAWDTETGWLQVGKNFQYSETVTATIVDGDEASIGDDASFDFEDGSDHGAYNGNKELITCTVVFVDGVVDVLEDIDEELAGILNADFDTDIFAAGQTVEIHVVATLTVQAIVPGRR